MMFLSSVVGVLVAIAIDQSMISLEGIAFIIVYAGGDFLMESTRLF